LEGVEQPKKSPKKLGNAFSDALLLSRFQNFAADAEKKNRAPRGILNAALRAVFIYESIDSFELIRGQRFSEAVFFTEREGLPFALGCWDL
jgi:hypothetical protein